ncbi:MAG: ADP-heptose:LPS heptosyltransferase, partial [Planctomycetota bacterium]
SWSSGAKDRAGLARADWREPMGARAMTRLAPAAAMPHAVDRAMGLARFVAPGAQLERYDLPLSDAERAQGQAWLEQLLPDRGRPRRILHLSVPGDRRSLPGSSYASLARGLEAAGEDWLLLSGPGEAELGRNLQQELPARPGRAHLVGQRGLRSLAALLAAAGEAQARFLVCDSGPCHVAAAVGAAVDLIAGPQDPELTGPWPPPDRSDLSGPASPHRIHRAPGPERNLRTWAPQELLASLLSPSPR